MKTHQPVILIVVRRRYQRTWPRQPENSILMNSRTSVLSSRWQSLILMALMLVLLSVLFLFIRANVSKPLPDYLPFWAAGRLVLERGNPYDPGALLTIQRNAGWEQSRELMMWHPPWVLPIMIPLGLMDYATGRTLWFFLQIVVVVFCSNSLWRQFGGREEKRWIGWLGSLLFIPTLSMLLWGQMGFLVLLGCTWFLMLTEPLSKQAGSRLKDPLRDFLAGASTILISVKPQALYLFWPILLVWVVERKRWSIIYGIALALGISVLLCLWLDPSIFMNYIHSVMVIRSPSMIYATPTLGFWLRAAFGMTQSWMQFVPCLGGLCWMILHYRSRRDGWSWTQEIPIFGLISILTTIYIWTHDEVILIPAILQILAAFSIAERTPTIYGLAGVWTLINCLSLVFHLKFSNQYLVWLAPVMLILYLWTLRSTCPQNHRQPESV